MGVFHFLHVCGFFLKDASSKSVESGLPGVSSLVERRWGLEITGIW